MTPHDQILLVLFAALTLGGAWPLGRWMTRLASERALPAALAALERPLYRLAGVAADTEMTWQHYAGALIGFNLLGAVALYALQRLQAVLPFNDGQLAGLSPDLSFNTAISFVTNTNWQAYSGETTMSFLTQMLGLAVQNFLSAATGIAVAFALIRALARHSGKTLGNFWVDVTRISLFLLLPLSVVLATVFIAEGTPQTMTTSVTAHLADPVHYDDPLLDAQGQARLDADGHALTKPATTDTQTIALGPIASQEAIKMLGTNGGGFFNANSAHPYENPTPLSNLLQMVAIFLLPAALCLTFGEMVGDRKQGYAILATMSAIFVVMAAGTIWSELHANPHLVALGMDPAGGNLEGKETRFGAVASALFATITTAASCGAVNAMHDSFMPLGGGIVMCLIQLGEVIFGGVGSGLYGMLIYALIAVFIAGLMIGRTPEYLGKKIETYEMQMSAITILITPLLVLLLTAIAVRVPAAVAGIANPNAHGFSEMLYAYSSAANNNGSAFAGLSANVPFYNITLALAMWFGRFGMIVPILAIAGSLVEKKRLPPSDGTLPTSGLLFIVLLAGVVVLVGALTYLPALALGPIVEHLQLFSGQVQ